MSEFLMLFRWMRSEMPRLRRRKTLRWRRTLKPTLKMLEHEVSLLQLNGATVKGNAAMPHR